MQNTAFMTGSICLTDIPKEWIKRADNGKLYLSVSGSAVKNPKFDDTHIVKASIKLADGSYDSVIIGNLKEDTPQVVTSQAVEDAPVAEIKDTDLPF